MEKSNLVYALAIFLAAIYFVGCGGGSSSGATGMSGEDIQLITCPDNFVAQGEECICPANLKQMGPNECLGLPEKFFYGKMSGCLNDYGLAFDLAGRDSSYDVSEDAYRIQGDYVQDSPNQAGMDTNIFWYRIKSMGNIVLKSISKSMNACTYSTPKPARMTSAAFSSTALTKEAIPIGLVERSCGK